MPIKNTTRIHPSEVQDLTVVASGEMSTWSEAKRLDFVATFHKRALCSRYVLLRTAELCMETAQRRQFISNFHVKEIEKRTKRPYLQAHYGSLELTDNRNSYNRTVSGRSVEELDSIAGERAAALLDGLPALKLAVKIVNADLAKKIERKEECEKRGQVLLDELKVGTEPIIMSEVDETMTVGAFRAMVKERGRRNDAILDELEELGELGGKLEREICKALYAGLPGLSDACIDVIVGCYEQAAALDTTTRRVEEQVKFGDSATALELLRTFEKDEVQVSDEVAARFKEAMATLRAAGQAQGVLKACVTRTSTTSPT